MTFKNEKPDGMTRIKENVEGFVSLIKKFSFKIKSFSEYVISLQTNSNKEIVDEIRETFRIYNTLLENPNLAASLTENKPYYPMKESSYINQFSLTNMFTNLERVIDELHLKNEQLDLEKNMLQKQSIIKKEYDDLKLTHEKYKSDFSRVLQYNKDLESKLSILEEENSNLRKTIAYEKDKFDDLLRQKLNTLNKEMRYKDSKIQYYENIVQNVKGTYNLYNDKKETYFNKSLSKFNEDNDLRRSVQAKANNDTDIRRSVQLQSHKSISPYKMKYQEKSTNFEKLTITNKNENETQNSFKSEIDHLDMEISDLKNQLKTKMVK